MSNPIYLNSDKIKVFPAVGRSADTYPESVTTTEKSLTHLSSFPHNNDSYVISDKVETPLKFIIHGYYFEADISSYLSESSSLWVAIKIDTSDQTTTYQELVRLESSSSTSQKENLDDNTDFKGLGLYTEKPDSSENGVYVLQLLEKGNIPITSKIHYYTTEICNKNDDSVTTLDTEVNTKTLNATTATITPEVKFSEASSNKITLTDSSITIGDSTQNNSNSVTLNGGNSSIKVGTTDNANMIAIQAGDTLSASAGVVSLNGYTTNITGSTINISGNTTASGNSINLKTNTNISKDLSVTGKITCNGITSNSHDLEKGKYTISVDDSGNLTITENW